MDKCCKTCKWYYNKYCNNKNIPLVNSSQEILGTSYIEDGVLIETLRESLDIKKLINPVLEQLAKELIIKKSYINNPEKLMDKLNDDDDIREEMVEIIDFALDQSIRNYFDVGISDDSKFSVDSPDEFYCSLWE